MPELHQHEVLTGLILLLRVHQLLKAHQVQGQIHLSHMAVAVAGLMTQH
jgi:hypothetical protein